MQTIDASKTFAAIRSAISAGTVTLVPTESDDGDYTPGDRLVYGPIPDAGEVVIHQDGKTGWFSTDDWQTFTFDLEAGTMTDTTIGFDFDD